MVKIITNTTVKGTPFMYTDSSNTALTEKELCVNI